MNPEIGELVEAEVGPVAHGGHCVARLPGEGRGRVVFVRHALPGERVRIRITEESGSFLRGDAVEVLDPSPHRVAAPCPLAHPGGCGGCDFQHVELAEQRRLKAAVVHEQLQRLAKIDREVVCEPVPGDDQGLRWRTRMQYVGLPDGRRGLRKHRSHEVVPVEDCLIAHPEARETMYVADAVDGASARPGRVGHIEEQVLGRRFAVAADGFWQVHPGAPRVLVETVLDQLAPQRGDHALDLYAGVGLFSVFLAEAVGESGSVTAVESDARAGELARTNLAGLRQADAVARPVERWLRANRRPVDLVVLDPPRAGARREVVRNLARLRPRALSYVACDPAALARDLAIFADAGYALSDLRCFDLFPMTHHVECVALVRK